MLDDNSMSYGDYVWELTYLLFLKMVDERSRPPYVEGSLIPAQYAWSSLLARDWDELFDHYRHTLEALGQTILARAFIAERARVGGAFWAILLTWRDCRSRKT